MNSLPSDDLILEALGNDNVKIFKLLFENYYGDLVKYALRILHKPVIAEEIVQDIFERLWLRRREIQIHHSFSAYLYSSVRYQCINYFKSKMKDFVFEANILRMDQIVENTPYDELVLHDLKEALRLSIETLPEQCQIIFKLSRNAGLSNPEIAEQLNLSPKTVENQITIALKKIREFLQKNWYVIFLVSLWGCSYFHLT